MTWNGSMPPSSAVPPALGPSVPECHVRWEIPEFLQWTLAVFFLALSWFLLEFSADWCLRKRYGRQHSRRQGNSRKIHRRSSSGKAAVRGIVQRGMRVLCYYAYVRPPYLPESEARPSGSTSVLPTSCMSFFPGFSSPADTMTGICTGSVENLPKSEPEEEVMEDDEENDDDKQQ